MIRRIEKVSKAGLFQNWSPAGAVEDFRRINVIYGGNGCGKSTLADVFDKLSRQEPTPGSIQIQASEGGSRRSLHDPSDPFWSRLRVFNTTYISRNLFFDKDEGSDTLPLLVVGEKNIDREMQLAVTENQIAEIDENTLEIGKSAAQHKKVGDTIATDTARIISQELSNADARFDSRRYTATAFRKGLAHALTECSADVGDDLRIAQSKQMGAVQEVGVTELDLDHSTQELTALLANQVLNIAIAELESNRSAEQWVHQGLGLHRDLARCLFCDGPLTVERRTHLDKHFDESFLKLQKDLDNLDRKLDSLGENAHQSLVRAPDPGLLYEDLRARYEAHLKVAYAEVKEYQARVSWMRDLIEDKRSKPFSALELPVGPGASSLSFTAIDDLLRAHNRRNEDFKSTVRQAAARIEQTRLTEAADSYNDAVSKESADRNRLSDLAEERGELSRQREKLRVTDLDPTILAEELTRDLGALLGRQELAFTAQEGKYSITRDGNPATKLSEGERTAISLLYFLCSLRGEGTAGIEATVIIDDPVTSLDDEILSGASSHLWTTFVGKDSKHQVFLFTHSFGLFRMWGNQLDRLPGSLKRKQQYAYTIHELRTGYKEAQDGTIRRTPKLIYWGDENLRRKLRSQYHYLFWRVGGSLIEHQEAGGGVANLEAALVIPNAARQMLEGFLAFKYPGAIGDFRGSVEKAMKEPEVTDAIRHRVTQFLNQQSHNEEADVGRAAATGEAATVLAATMDLVRAVDRDHFEQMCSALDLNLESILT